MDPPLRISTDGAAATPPVDPHIGFVIQQVENDYQASEESVREKFAWSLSVLQKLTGLEHKAFLALEDASMIYQISGWSSMQQHYEMVHNTSTFQDFFEVFGDVLDAKASYHTGISYKLLPREASHFTLLRCRVPPSRKSGFSAALEQWMASMLKIHGTKACSGWRMEGGWEDQYRVNDLERYGAGLVGRFEEEADEAEECDVLLPWTDATSWKAELDRDALKPVLENLVSLEVKRLYLMDTNVPK